MDGKFDFRVGRGAPLGQALRRYWTPACFSRELAGPDCDPIRLRLLGDSFVAFRDSSGTVGVLDEHCPHRRASLVYGRNEGGGLRCLWHQWKFATDGRVLETPNTTDCMLKDRVRAKAYPVRESGGIVWTYLGPPELEPEFPEYGWAKMDEEHRVLVAIDIDCHFSKGVESLLDSSHVGLLHEDSIRNSPRFRASISIDPASGAVDGAPELVLEPADFGLHYVSLRDAASGRLQARLSVYAAPYICFVAPQNTAFISIPRDDTHTRMFIVMWSPRIRITPVLRAEWVKFMGLDPGLLEACGMTPAMPGEARLENRNRFVQDRDGMRAGRTYSGLGGLMIEDTAMLTSIPGMSDYSQENLTASDAAVVQFRRMLARMARNPDADDLPGLRLTFAADKLNAASGVIERREDWKSIAPYLRDAAPA